MVFSTDGANKTVFRTRNGRTHAYCIQNPFSGQWSDAQATMRL